MTDPQDTQVEDAQNITAAVRAGMALGRPRTPAGLCSYTIEPEGGKVVYLRNELANPTRIKARPTLHDAPSLIAYVNDHNAGLAHLFANIDTSTVVAIIDYHRRLVQGAQSATDESASPTRPQYADHHAVFTARHSEEWKTWMAANGKPMSQVAFAQFLEDNAPDVTNPTGADLMEIAENIQVSRSGSFKSKINRSSTSIHFGYSEENNATVNSVEIPKEFDVQLRPYIGCSHHKLTAKLRFKVEDGSLMLWFDLIRAEVLRREAFDAIIKRIADETKTAVLLGTP